MPAHKKPGNQREYKVGDRIIVSLSAGRVEEAVVKAVIQSSSETRLIVNCPRSDHLAERQDEDFSRRTVLEPLQFSLQCSSEGK